MLQTHGQRDDASGFLTIAKEKKFKNGPSTKERGCTHASVSESMIDEDASIPTADAVSAASMPTLLAEAKSSKSVGSACNGAFLRTGAADATRWIGAKPAQDGIAARNVAMAKSFVILIGQKRCVAPCLLCCLLLWGG